MEPTLSTPASFRLGQAPLSSWQRPWKFSCSKMAIWKRAGPQRGCHPAVPGTAHLQQPTMSLSQNCSPEALKEACQVHGTAAIPLRMQVSLTDAHQALSQCSWQRDAHTHIEQLRGSGCGWSTAATRGTRGPRHRGQLVAQHRAQGWWGHICCVCSGGGRSALDLSPSAPPAPRLRDAKKIPFPIPSSCCKQPSSAAGVLGTSQECWKCWQGELSCSQQCLG